MLEGGKRVSDSSDTGRVRRKDTADKIIQVVEDHVNLTYVSF